MRTKLWWTAGAVAAILLVGVAACQEPKVYVTTMPWVVRGPDGGDLDTLKVWRHGSRDCLLVREAIWRGEEERVPASLVPAEAEPCPRCFPAE